MRCWGGVDLYTAYVRWCRNNHVKPFPPQAFSRIAEEEIELEHGLRYRHDPVFEDGKAHRGWKGVAKIERPDAEDIAVSSRKSETTGVPTNAVVAVQAVPGQ